MQRHLAMGCYPTVIRCPGQPGTDQIVIPAGWLPAHWSVHLAKRVVKLFVWAARLLAHWFVRMTFASYCCDNGLCDSIAGLMFVVSIFGIRF